MKSILISELNAIQQTTESDDKISSVVPIGKFVSSHANFVKKRKTHGTNYHRK